MIQSVACRLAAAATNPPRAAEALFSQRAQQQTRDDLHNVPRTCIRVMLYLLTATEPRHRDGRRAAPADGREQSLRPDRPSHVIVFHLVTE